MRCFLYDLFAHKSYRKLLQRTQIFRKSSILRAENLVGVSQFADAVTDDSRLVIRVLHEAQNDGACCLNYVAAQELIKKMKAWWA